MRKCTHCRKWYSEEDYYLRKDHKPGSRMSWCKYCMKRARVQWYLENRNRDKTKSRLAAADYYYKHKKKVLAKSTKHRRKMRNAVLDRYGRRCAHCGFTNELALQIDHIFGHGRQELKNLGNGSSQYLKRVLFDTKGRYQILCANCNLIKYRQPTLALVGPQETEVDN